MNSSIRSLQDIRTTKSVDFKSRMVRVQSCAASLSCLGLSTVHPSKVEFKPNGSTGSLISIYDDEPIIDEPSENK